MQWTHVAVVRLIGLLIASAHPVSDASAYELITHAKTAEQAFDQATRIKQYLDDVGIEPGRIFERDDTASSRSARESAAFAGYENDGSARGWLAAGAIREDDYAQRLLGSLAGCPTPRNPPSPIDRPLHHFLDVQRGGLGLNIALLPLGFPAADWALGLQGRGPDPSANQFSLLDARQYQLQSLTAATRAERDEKTALMFRTLGHVVHLLQDMAQPQHTRNDAHAGCDHAEAFAGKTSWFERYIESRAQGTPFRARGEPSAPLETLLTGYEPASLPTPGAFWSNPDRSGLADFSSRNFFTAATNLSFRNVLFGSLLGGCGNLPEPPCTTTGLQVERRPVTVRTIHGTTLTGDVTLYRRDVPDLLTGQVIPGVAVSSRSLWDEHLESRNLLPSFSLNTLVYDSIAAALLPRAVGYGAGLLDHFFRGRLDGEVVIEDDARPEEVRFAGVNASAERLDGGRLELYVEDADGRRSPLPPAAPGADLTIAADPGAPVQSAAFTVAEDAERFVVVYRGALGAERPGADPVREPGAVIGKVLGGVRVEEVFSDGVRWQLRTPKGVFPLPIESAEIEDLRWGDLDNTLVGRTPFGPGRPSRFVTFRIAREVGATEVPLRPPDAAGLQLVDVERTGEATFPFGLATGTTVTFSGRARLVERLVTFEGTAPEEGLAALHFDPELEEYYTLGSIAHAGEIINTPEGLDDPARRDRVLRDHMEFENPTTAQVAVPMDETHDASAVFDVALDAGRLADNNARPYTWRLTDFGLDAAGRILAHVVVELTRPENNSRTVMSKLHHPITGALVDAAPQELVVVFPLPFQALAHVVVDVASGQVVSSTAGTTVALAHESVKTLLLTQARITGVAQGGPLSGQMITRWRQVRTFPALEDEPVELGPQVLVENISRHDVQDLYRPALSARAPHWLSTTTASGPGPRHLYAVVRDDHGTIVRRLAYDTLLTDSLTSGYLTLLRQSQRLRPGAQAEQLILLGRPIGIGEGDLGILVRYRPATTEAPETAEPVLPFELDAGEHRLAGTTSRGALVVSSFFSGASISTRLARLDRGELEFLDDRDLSPDFVLLDPTFLYHVGDTRFYTLTAPPARTALPARLAPGNPRGDYHVVPLD